MDGITEGSVNSYHVRFSSVARLPSNMSGSSISPPSGSSGRSFNAIFIESYFAPKSKFSVDDIPDLTGKVIIVTGGNTGIGKETPRYSAPIYSLLGRKLIHHMCAQALLAKNAKVYIAARSEERAKAAIEDLKQTTGKEAIWLKLDLSSLKSVKAAAEEFLGCVHRVISSRQDLIHTFIRKETELHVLFNNACVFLPHRED
jgi:retinol dehydrogenase-12